MPMDGLVKLYSFEFENEEHSGKSALVIHPRILPRLGVYYHNQPINCSIVAIDQQLHVKYLNDNTERNEKLSGILKLSRFPNELNKPAREFELQFTGHVLLPDAILGGLVKPIPGSDQVSLPKILRTPLRYDVINQILIADFPGYERLDTGVLVPEGM